MSKRCKLQKEYFKEFGHYKGNGNGNYSDGYVKWLESKVLALRIGSVRHSANFHAKALLKKLTTRPHLKCGGDGYYDMIADEKQMIEIVEKYFGDNFEAI